MVTEGSWDPMGHTLRPSLAPRAQSSPGLCGPLLASSLLPPSVSQGVSACLTKPPPTPKHLWPHSLQPQPLTAPPIPVPRGFSLYPTPSFKGNTWPIPQMGKIEALGRSRPGARPYTAQSGAQAPSVSPTPRGPSLRQFEGSTPVLVARAEETGPGHKPRVPGSQEA